MSLLYTVTLSLCLLLKLNDDEMMMMMMIMMVSSYFSTMYSKSTFSVLDCVFQSISPALVNTQRPQRSLSHKSTPFTEPNIKVM